MDLHNIRQDYAKQALSPEQCAKHPIAQFETWLQEAIAAQVPEPTAMNLACVDEHQRPNNRIVLLKEVNEQGFVFFTNYHSKKGASLLANPFAALTFFWAELERQVRVEGRVFRLPEADSDAYFASRPYASRVGAWASEQSQVIESQNVLIKRAALFAAKYPLNVPRPPHWGGYCVQPDRVEFWQGRPSRLHDRVCYEWENDTWHKRRLAP